MVQQITLDGWLALILIVVIIFPRLFSGKGKGVGHLAQFVFKGLEKLLELFFKALFELLKGAIKILGVLLVQLFKLLSALVRWIYNRF